MSFYEKVVRQAKLAGYVRIGDFWKACGIGGSQQVNFKKNGQCTDGMKLKISGVLHCGVGALNEMQAQALAEDLASKGEYRPGEKAKNQKTSSEAKRSVPVKAETEPVSEEIEQPAPIQEADATTKAVEPPSEPATPQQDEEISAEPEETPEKDLAVDPQDIELEKKINLVELQVEANQLSYYDLMYVTADEVLKNDYDRMRREKMRIGMEADMDNVCNQWLKHRNEIAAAHVFEVFEGYRKLLKEIKQNE